MVENLRAQLIREGVPAATIETLISDRIRPVTGEASTWQQDYFESSFDPATGAPRIRFSPVYNLRIGSRFGPTAKAIGNARVCGLANAQPVSCKFKIRDWSFLKD
jgi:hypothetical protein